MIVRELTPEARQTIAAWRYPDRYATYAFDDPSVLLRDHWAVYDPPDLVGCCCSRAVASRLGFAYESTLTTDDGDFVVMVRE